MYISSSQVAMDNNGNAIVVWEQKWMSGPRVIYAIRYSAGAWGAVTGLSFVEQAWSPQMAMAISGNAMVVWEQYDQSADRIGICAIRYSDSSWGAVTTLGSGGIPTGGHGRQRQRHSGVGTVGQHRSTEHIRQAFLLWCHRSHYCSLVPDPELCHARQYEVTLTWTAPSSNGDSAIDYYVVYQDGVALADHQARSDGRHLGPEQRPSVQLHHRGAQYSRHRSKVKRRLIDPIFCARCPEGLAGTLGDGQVTLNWTAPVFNGGRSIDYYIVYQDGVALPYHLTGPSTIIAGLTNGHAYSFTVCAHNLAGIGPQTTAVTITPSTVPTVPSAPTGLSAGPRNGQVSLGWSAPSATGGAAIDYYIVYQDGTDIAHPTSTST